MITTPYLQSAATWFYEGMPYRIRKRGHLWCIEGLDGGVYGNVNWFGEQMIKVDAILFGTIVEVTLLYEDMQASAATIKEERTY